MQHFQHARSRGSLHHENRHSHGLRVWGCDAHRTRHDDLDHVKAGQTRLRHRCQDEKTLHTGQHTREPRVHRWKQRVLVLFVVAGRALSHKSRAEAPIPNVQAGCQSVHTRVSQDIRHTRETLDISQAGGETVKKVTFREASTLLNEITTLEGTCRGTLARREDKCRITRTTENEECGDHTLTRIRAITRSMKCASSSASSLRRRGLIERDAARHVAVQFNLITSAFTVNDDFLQYTSGVYHNVNGSALDGHIIKIFGQAPGYSL